MESKMENLNNLDALDLADEWKIPIFRQRLVKEMENIIEQSGSADIFKSGEMESHVFSKVKTRAEYLTAMAKIKMNLKNICNNMNQNPDSFNKQGEPDGNPHNHYPDGIPLTRAQASWITKQADLVNECIIELRRFLATLGFGRLLKGSGNEDWKSSDIRQVVIDKIENEFQMSGLEIARDGNLMEKHVFLTAKSCPEYVNMVSKLIVHVRGLAQQKQNPDPDVIYLISVKTQKNPWLAQICDEKLG